MKDSSSHSYLKKLALISATLLIPFLILELGIRIANPSNPYYSQINREKYGPFSRYDSLIGWSGTPDGKFWDNDGHSSVLYVNNSLGYRDIEHDPSSSKPAVVFLGGSYPWGQYVEFDENFVEVLRHKLTNYEIYNFAFDCYGPDQDLLLFNRWADQYKGQIKLVVLTESMQDVRRVGVSTECGMPKPKFEIAGDELVLTGVPVPEIPRWKNEAGKKPEQLTRMQQWKKNIRTILFHSYFLHAIYDRIREQYSDLRYSLQEHPEVDPDPVNSYVITKEDLALTSGIFEELKKSVEARGAELVIVFVPSMYDVEDMSDTAPYQDEIKPICVTLGIACLDPLQDFIESGKRTHRRSIGGHWTPDGHRIAAESIYNFLIDDLRFELKPDNAGGN